MADKNQPEMVDAVDAEGKTVQIPKTTPEETIPTVKTQRGVIFSRAEQDRQANANLRAQETAGVDSASPQTPEPTNFPPTSTGAPARGGATRSSTTRPKGQE